ncbi:MAG: gene transfer agent family protein [Hyphomicrobiaceae bacterium]|nr:gene transfer agent family protein [Hyphomicrobiaceae bacterium]
MLNRHRGEVGVKGSGPLRLTLDGLARLEDHFHAEGLADLAEKLATRPLEAHDLIAILALGLKGAGRDCRERDVEALVAATGLAGAGECAARLLAEAFTVRLREEEECAR